MSAQFFSSQPATPLAIRSFVRRDSRMTAAQARALDELWPRFGVDLDSHARLKPGELFRDEAPVSLEIGFGNGESLLALARAYPQRNFIGVEVHRPGIGHTLLGLEREPLSNVRLICLDAVILLDRHLDDASLAAVLIFFPDPWPKKRHHKRRLIQTGFITLLARKLQPGGLLHIATDWQHYAEHILTVLEQSVEFTNTVDGYAPRPAERPETRFERRGKRKGHCVRDLVFRR